MALTGWQQALPRWLGGRRDRAPVAVSLLPGELVLARRGEHGPAFVHQACESPEAWPARLYQLLSEQHLTGHPVQLVLSAGHYQVIQAERPANVPEEELAGALLWSVRDQLGFSPADAVADTYDIPAQADQRVNLVAAQRSQLARLVNSVTQAGAKPAAITTEEMALRSLLPAGDEALLMLVQQPEREPELLVVRQGALYVSRQLRGMSRLSSYTPQELAEGALEMLSLELQRSMDYFESQLRQAPVSRILVAMAVQDETAAVEQLRQFFAVPVGSLRETCQLAQQIESIELNQLAALGGLLEQEGPR